MSVHTREHPIELTFVGPYKNKAAAIKHLKPFGFHAVENSVPWDEAFPDLAKSAGAILAGARYKEDMTQAELSRRTGIPQRHISEMENDKRPIGKANAKKFAKVLNINYRVFL
jgi:ribosome-binding protein aMBF1 (putative translation factor)